MAGLRSYSLEEIALRLNKGDFPFSGVTLLESATFHFREPAGYMGIALHNGSRIRPQLLDTLAVSQEERFREEDPFTELFVQDFPIQLIARDSRFEYDLNWDIEKCIYPYENQKWGLKVWHRPLNREEITTTYSKFREFHALLDLVVDHLLKHYPLITLFDIHSFCYRREGESNWWEDSKPEINLGTRFINRPYFTPLIETFLKGVSELTLGDHPLRVGENEIFPGGYLTRKFSESHNCQVLVLAIEYKKIFMDELTGELFPHTLEPLRENLLLTKDRIMRTKL